MEQTAIQIWMLIVGPLTGGVIAAGVAWVTNYRSDIRDSRRLQFEGEQKEIDRKLALKREIYLAVASDYARFAISAATLADTSVESLKTAFATADLAASSIKLEIVAPLGLVQAVHGLGAFIRSSFGGIITDRLRLQQKLSFIEDAIDQLKNSNPTGNDANLLTKVAELQAEAQILQHNFRFRCMQYSLELKKRLIPMTREMRREFDTCIDMKQFDDVITSGLHAAEVEFGEFLLNLHKDFGENCPDHNLELNSGHASDETSAPT